MVNWRIHQRFAAPKHTAEQLSRDPDELQFGVYGRTGRIKDSGV